MLGNFLPVLPEVMSQIFPVLHPLLLNDCGSIKSTCMGVGISFLASHENKLKKVESEEWL